MNLSTARATGRAREVGIRKTLGSERGQLIRQFLGESITMSPHLHGDCLCLSAIALACFRQCP